MIGTEECSSKASPDCDASSANWCSASGRVMDACQQGRWQRSGGLNDLLFAPVPVAFTRMLIQSLLGAVFFAPLLFLPAGTWAWPQGWAYLGLFNT
jgi:hypothetical protein